MKKQIKSRVVVDCSMMWLKTATSKVVDPNAFNHIKLQSTQNHSLQFSLCITMCHMQARRYVHRK
jgi:hypothetical protein